MEIFGRSTTSTYESCEWNYSGIQRNRGNASRKQPQAAERGAGCDQKGSLKETSSPAEGRGIVQLSVDSGQHQQLLPIFSQKTADDLQCAAWSCGRILLSVVTELKCLPAAVTAEGVLCVVLPA